MRSTATYRKRDLPGGPKSEYTEKQGYPVENFPYAR
jgi:hypothetical protein